MINRTFWWDFFYACSWVNLDLVRRMENLTHDNNTKIHIYKKRIIFSDFENTERKDEWYNYLVENQWYRTQHEKTQTWYVETVYYALISTTKYAFGLWLVIFTMSIMKCFAMMSKV